ncbi:hypothetical protein BX600DRAFT_448353 [Xylariales sp. PMI_506]|nr:hypothetical protein BX600DRAFT_448353 [Xylariales sp. PMI_506]
MPLWLAPASPVLCLCLFRLFRMSTLPVTNSKHDGWNCLACLIVRRCVRTHVHSQYLTRTPIRLIKKSSHSAAYTYLSRYLCVCV